MWQVYAIGFIFLYGISDLLSKKVLNKEDALVFSFYRFFIPMLFLFLVFPFIDVRISLEQALWVYLISVIATVAFYFRNTLIKKIDVGYVVCSLSIVGLATFTLAVIFLKEAFSFIQLGFILLGILGFLLLQRSQNIDYKIMWYLLGAILLFAIAITLDKHVLSFVPVLTFIFYINIFFSLNFGALVLLERKKFKVPKIQMLYLVIISALVLSTQFAQYTAKSLGPIGMVTPVLLASSLITLFGSKIFFKEKHVLVKTIATVLIIIGAAGLLVM